jgi:hypothetical protein
MLTGIEVAGVVLGVLPLVISALEHYAEGVGTIKRFLKFQREFKSLIVRLKAEQLMLSNSTRLLLEGVVTTEEQLDILLNEPERGYWNDKKLDDELRASDYETYKIYVDIMAEVRLAVEELKTKLGIDSKGNVSAALLELARKGSKSGSKRRRFTQGRTTMIILLDHGT